MPPYNGTYTRLREQPFCNSCGKERSEQETLSRCSRCKLVWYCSVACQQSDFGQHKRTCRRIAPEAENLKNFSEVEDEEPMNLFETEVGSFWVRCSTLLRLCSLASAAFSRHIHIFVGPPSSKVSRWNTVVHASSPELVLQARRSRQDGSDSRCLVGRAFPSFGNVAPLRPRQHGHETAHSVPGASPEPRRRRLLLLSPLVCNGVCGHTTPRQQGK